MKKDLLTENEVIDAVVNYFNTKGRTEVKKVVSRADASQKEHGVDLQIKLANAKGNGNKFNQWRVRKRNLHFSSTYPKEFLRGTLHLLPKILTHEGNTF